MPLPRSDANKYVAFEMSMGIYDKNHERQESALHNGLFYIFCLTLIALSFVHMTKDLFGKSILHSKIYVNLSHINNLYCGNLYCYKLLSKYFKYFS